MLLRINKCYYFFYSVVLLMQSVARVKGPYRNMVPPSTLQKKRRSDNQEKVSIRNMLYFYIIFIS